MSSTAILISGQLRTFARCYPTQRWHVLRHLADPHFFITVQSQPDADEILAPLRADFGADRVHVRLLSDPDLTPELTPELSAAYREAPYANAADAHQLLLQHWYQNEVWKDFAAFSFQFSALSFDLILRLRPDLWFHSFDISNLKSEMHARSARVPWWGRFGGLNDRFALLGPAAAFAYFTVYAQLPSLLAAGCPFHPETLVRAALEANGITVDDTLRAEFSTLRLDGRMRPPEITHIDLAHAALRAA